MHDVIIVGAGPETAAQKYRRLHPDRVKAAQQKFREANRERLNKQRHEHHLAHIEQERGRSKRYKKGHAEGVARSNAGRRKSNKAKAVEYLGGQCVDCGLRTCNLAVYEFDHKDPTVKTHRNDRHSFGRGWSWERIKAELDTCELRCANCHRIRHAGSCEEVA